jgi:CheY-like chemotaxis protein
MTELAAAYGPTGTSPAHHEKGLGMPARVVLVHDHVEFADELAGILRSEGHDVATFPDPLAAWDALEAVQRTEVLVTCVEFPPGRSNGIAIAHMARTKRKEIQLIFTALPEHARIAEEDGIFMPITAPATEVAAAVNRLLVQKPD